MHPTELLNWVKILSGFIFVGLCIALATLVLSTISYDTIDSWDNCDSDTDCITNNTCRWGICDKGECTYFTVEGCCDGDCTGENVTANYEFNSICTNEINVCNNLTSSSNDNMFINNIIGDGVLSINGNLLIEGNLNVSGIIYFSNITFSDNSSLSELFNSFTENISPNVTIGNTINGSIINSTIEKLGDVIYIYFEGITFDDCDNNTLTSPNNTISDDFLPFTTENEFVNFQTTVINNGEMQIGSVKLTSSGSLQWYRYDHQNGVFDENFIGECGITSSWINYFIVS
jgi:hypothetical protein